MALPAPVVPSALLHLCLCQSRGVSRYFSRHQNIPAMNSNLNLRRRAHRHRAVGRVLLLALGLLGAAILPAKSTKDKTSPITFAPAGGAYGSNVAVRLAAPEGAVLRYTLDGREPDETSPAYTAPLLITNTMLVRVKMFSKDDAPTADRAEVFTRLDEDLAKFQSTLPLVIVHSFGTNLTHEARLEGAVQIIEPQGGHATLALPASLSGRALLNVRGRASLRYPKNSLTVKSIDATGDALSVAPLGLPADSDWVLYAPYPDKALLRDVLAYELHAAMGHWAPRAQFVEVFINRTGGPLTRKDYAGVYVFEERVKRGKERVNIAKLKPEDLSEPEVTGGYIFKKDHVDTGGGPMGGEGYGAGPTTQNTRAGFPTRPGGFPGDPKGFLPTATTTRTYSSGSSSRSRITPVVTNHIGFASTRLPSLARDILYRDEMDSVKDEEYFRTTRTNQFYFVEPDPDEITAVQKAWLKNHLNQLEAALYGPDFRDPAKGYRAFIDADSFIDYHLLTEMTKNVDGYRFSVFYHKDRGGKVKADPVWDWNLSFGNANGKQGWLPEYWLWPQLDDRELTWYRRLFDDPDFGQRYVDRFAQLRTNVFSTRKILARVDAMAAQLGDAQKRNYERWPILGRAINPNWYVFSTYEEEVGWVKKFIDLRLAWMEAQFPAVPALGSTADQTTLTTKTGEIYYTLDGTDPRAPGGEVAKGATLYKSGVAIAAGAKLFARTRVDGRWSGPRVTVTARQP